MLKAKIDRLVRNLAFLILEGSERQTADTRPTSGLPMESLEYDSSNEWKVGGTKIERTLLRYFFFNFF